VSDDVESLKENWNVVLNEPPYVRLENSSLWGPIFMAKYSYEFK